MSIKPIKISSITDLIKKASLNETADYMFILPSLETKKEMVEIMAKEQSTVPDKRILRLNEFFITLVTENEPLIQLLDKDLLILLLKDSLSADTKYQPYIPFTQVALDYVSIFAPILGRDIYREALEEFIESDSTFLKNYGDIYEFMIQIWDQLIQSKRILPAWSLGWLYKNLNKVESKPKDVYILGFNKLKNIEKEFFEELSKTWNIYDAQINKDSNNLIANVNTVVNLTSLSDEILWCLEYLKKYSNEKIINFIIPKNKWFYKELLECFVDTNVKVADDEDNIRNKMNEFLSPLRVLSNDYKNSDIQYLLNNQQENFLSYNDLKLQTTNVFDLNLLKDPASNTDVLPKDNKINFLSFLDWALLSKTDRSISFKEDILRKLYSYALQIPNDLFLNYKDWFGFINLKLEKTTHSLKSKNFNFYTIEEMPWDYGATNIFLSCTRNSYEKREFAYLSDFEVEKIKLDLGFDLQGIDQAESFSLELDENAKQEMNNYFICPSFDHIGSSQQRPKFVEALVNNHETNVELYEPTSNEIITDELNNINQCELLDFEIKHLSASSLQKYITDPFSYFQEKVLNLRIDEPLDIDPSNLMSGSIFHLLLEKGIDHQVDRKKLEDIIQKEIRSVYKNWKSTNSQEKQIIKYVQNFVEYIERDSLEKKTKNRKTLYVEKDFEAYFELSDLKFYKEFKKGRILFKGKIDRIDLINDKCFVIDYKSTKSSIDSVRNLKAMPQIQMPLYAMMILDKIIDIQFPLVGLAYIAIKDDFEVIPAMILKEDSEFLMGTTLSSRNNASVDIEEFLGVINEYRSYIKSVILDIQNNNFKPTIFEGEKRSYFTDY